MRVDPPPKAAVAKEDEEGMGGEVEAEEPEEPCVVEMETDRKPHRPVAMTRKGKWKQRRKMMSKLPPKEMVKF
jgi:hypothetical protein